MMHPKEAPVTRHDAERKVKILDFIAAKVPSNVRELEGALNRVLGLRLGVVGGADAPDRCIH